MTPSIASSGAPPSSLDRAKLLLERRSLSQIPFHASEAGEPAPAIRSLLRQALLRAGRDLDTLEDQADCAEFLLLAGLSRAAGLVLRVVVIREGLQSSLGRRGDLAARTQLSTLSVIASNGAGEPQAASLDKALTQLQALCRTTPSLVGPSEPSETEEAGAPGPADGLGAPASLGAL